MQTKPWPWSVLDLEPGADERSVRRAYARILKEQRPDTDPDAFQRLRGAYEFALVLAQNATMGDAQVPQFESAQVGDLPAVAIPSAAALAISDDAALSIARDSHDAAESDVDRNSSLAKSSKTEGHRRSDPVQEAMQRWQDFVADPMNYRSRNDVSNLFAAVVNFQVREELEWQAILHCLRDDTPPRLRINLCDVLEWRQDHKHLLNRDAGVANVALSRAFADADYETLSQRYPAAISLLEDGEGMRKRMRRIVFDRELEREMDALIQSLNYYYQNVRQVRIDASLIERWQRRQSLRTWITGLVLPVVFQSLWFGVLVACASTMRGKNDSDWGGPWGTLQIVLASLGVMTYVAGVAAMVIFTQEQKARIQSVRENAWIRYGWIAVWLVTVATALATGPYGVGANAAAAALAGCTLWAAFAHGPMSVGRLLFTPLTFAVGLGFVGHWAAVDRPLWILALAHGVLATYFLRFALASFRSMVAARPRVAMALCVAWIVATVTFLITFQSGYAWGLYSVMVPVLSGMLAGSSWSRITDAIPFPLRNFLIVIYWWVFGLMTPNLAAACALLVLCLPVAVEMKRARNASKEPIGRAQA